MHTRERWPGLDLVPSLVEFKAMYLAAVRGLSWEGFMELLLDTGCRKHLG